MAETATRRRTAPPGVSALAAAAIPVWIIATMIVGTIAQTLARTPWQPDAFPSDLGYLIQLGNLVSLAFAVGVFLSFWFIAPITGGIALPTLIVRMIVAAGVGAVTFFPAQLAWVLDYFATINAQTTTQPSLGGLVDLSTRTLGPLEAIAQTVGDSLQYTLVRLPLVLLAALGSWAWQRRQAHGHA